MSPSFLFLWLGLNWATFKDGEYEGEGILYYENGNKEYEGNFVNGMYNGEGILYSENNNIIFKGVFKNGKYSKILPHISKIQELIDDNSDKLPENVYLEISNNLKHDEDDEDDNGISLDNNIASLFASMFNR